MPTLRDFFQFGLRHQNPGQKVIKLQLCATYCKYACSIYLESLSSWKCQPNFSGDTSFLKIAKIKIILCNLTFVGRGALCNNVKPEIRQSSIHFAGLLGPLGLIDQASHVPSTPSPWLTRICFTLISLTHIFKMFPFLT